MASRLRDIHNKQNNVDHSRSRNKENIPSKPSRPSLLKTPGKEFYTDSFIEGDSTSSSLIPSPKRLTDANHSNPRRILVKQASRHRQSKSDAPSDLFVRHTKPSKPTLSNGLTTPPRSRQGSFVEDVLSSPPPALNLIYDRIDQEEDLAATEGELSDPEDNEDVGEPSHAKVLSKENLQRLSHPITTTPRTENPHRTRHTPNDDTARSVLSDPTGTSFVRQFADPKLRAIMTPHFEQTAEDKAALDRVWQSQRPIAFSKVGKVDKVLMDPDEVAQSISNSPHIQLERLVAFSKAGRVKLASDHLFHQAHQRAFSDVTDRIEPNLDSRRERHNDNWHNDDLKRDAMPHNPRLHREPYFPKVHAFPARDQAPHDQANQPYLATDIEPSVRRARSESPYVHRSICAGARASGQPLRDTTSTTNVSTAPSLDIWAEQADIPVNSIEKDHQRISERRFSDTRNLHTSPDYSRRFNFDFTGQSFQVSDSPPVRGKNVLQDYQRNREIRGVAKQAVTTSRLNQLRERESQERLRETSRSPVSETGRPEAQLTSPRLSSASLQRTLSNASVFENPTSQRSTSHEILQRLARGSSATPKSTPPSERIINGGPISLENINKEREPGDKSDGRSSDKNEPRDRVQATPKIIGGWTDTILPDTVRTIKRNQQNYHYTQTPHVNAGGWVDTPAASAQPNKLDTVTEHTEEIPEGLTDGIAKDNVSENTIIPEDGELPGLPQADPVGESVTRKVLENARNDQTRALDDDSLALGNTTIKSLENLLDMDETDITSISHALGDTEFLGNLGSKLTRIIKTIHEAQNGLSKIEDQIVHAPEPIAEPLTPVVQEQPSRTTLPFGLLTISIPFPILFRPRRPGQRLPRPTPIGWILTTIWTWYLTECIMAEIYSHPIYADTYTWPTEPEPEFPFVLPTMLWRWSRLECIRPWIIEPFKMMILAFFRTIAITFGLTDGFAKETEIVGATTVEQPLMEEYGFGMTNDEFL